MVFGRNRDSVEGCVREALISLLGGTSRETSPRDQQSLIALDFGLPTLKVVIAYDHDLWEVWPSCNALVRWQGQARKSLFVPTSFPLSEICSITGQRRTVMRIGIGSQHVEIRDSIWMANPRRQAHSQLWTERTEFQIQMEPPSGKTPAAGRTKGS